ncbi:MAG: LysM peptidoglycan-binding domain-containing protein [Patescibacteria group bacterium]|nr:LysM peptidoglycan-binding domain-containing protein [Patescibacteria group bacterium]
MNKQTRAVFFFLLALVAILAGSTSFFAAKTYKISNSNKSKPSTTASVSIDSGTSPATTSSSAVVKAASSVEKPSKPADTYMVQKGETLFVVAQAQGSSWQDIAEVNGMSDVDKIQAGQTIILPKAGQVDFTVDNIRSTSLQKDADLGKYQFRLSPEDTARSDAPNVYGLKVTDTFTLKSRDNGQAQVQATKEGKNFIIKLIQPVTKGDKGIWAIESIRPI